MASPSLDASGDGAALEGPEGAPAAVSPALPAPAPASVPVPVYDAANTARQPDVLLRVTLALFLIGFAVWSVLAWTSHRRQYSAAGAAWHRGARNFIEITLIREDRNNLACAADAVIDGLHCGFGADRKPHSLNRGDSDPLVLRPYNTMNGELFLGAGLWGSAGLPDPLPAGRFTMYCDLEIVGALRSLALRWAPTGSFDPIDKTVVVGALRDCAIPQ